MRKLKIFGFGGLGGDMPALGLGARVASETGPKKVDVRMAQKSSIVYLAYTSDFNLSGGCSPIVLSIFYQTYIIVYVFNKYQWKFIIDK